MRLSLARSAVVLAAATALTLSAGMPALASIHKPTPPTHFYVPPAPDGSRQQIGRLIGQRDLTDAVRIAKMVTTPQAVWLSGGTPRQVQQDVRRTMLKAGLQHAVPTLVAYNLPYRDCGQYSAGGAAGTTAYEAWIDGFANGIGMQKAIVILEPDGLGLIPNYVSELDGSQNCTVSGPEATPAARFEQLNYAVDVLTALPNTAVYLDATHSGWQNVSESAFRLLKVDVEQTDGFYLNASNYQYTSDQVHYGTWVSMCIDLATSASGSTGDPVGPLGSGFPDCPSQYWSGGPATSWSGTALSPYKVWTTDWSGAPEDLDATVLGIYSRYAEAMGDPQGTTHFVIDTSRNGQGPWDWAAAGYSDAGTAQDWCNPPGRGLGIAPSTDTENDLVDAYLWIKVPGESDGSCTRDGSTGDMDPERGIIDPAAGAWFPQQARELITLANPEVSQPGHHHFHHFRFVSHRSHNNPWW